MQEEAIYEEVDEQQDPIPKPKKLKVKDFAAKIKQKYPDYKDVDDLELTNKIIAKYPVYKDQVDFTVETIKKKMVGSVGLEKSSLEAGNSLSQSNGEGGEIPTIELYNLPNGEMVETDPISVAQKFNDLSNRKKTINGVGGSSLTMGTTIQEVADEDAIISAKQLQKDFPNVDIKGISEELKDFPQEAFTREETSKENLMRLREENPIEYKNIINSTKTVYNIAEKSDIATANRFNQLNNIEYGSLEGFISGKREQQDIINSALSGEERTKALKRLQENSAPLINLTNPDLVEEYKASGFTGKINANQYAGLKTLEIFEPEKYKQAIKFLKSEKPTEYEGSMGLTFSNEGFELGKAEEKETEESINYKKGMEAIQKSLADIGRDNASKFAKNKMDGIGIAYKNAQSEEEKLALQQEYLKVKSIIDDVKLDISKDDEKYPLLAQMKFDNQVKELTGQAGMNPLEYGVYRFGKGFEKSGNSVGNVLTSLFGSDSDIIEREATALGEMQTEQSDAYMPANLQGTQPQVIFEFPKELKKQRNEILKDNTISETQKQEALTELVSKNQGSIETITNTNAGKHANFFSKATLYGNAGILGDIAAIAAQSMAIGGAGAGRLISTAVPMFTVTQDDFYKQAISEGKSGSEANAYANTHALIMAAAGLINPKLDIVKRSLGMNTVVGKTIAGIDEKTWNSVISKNKPILDRFVNSAKSVGKEGGKMVAVYGAGTSIANDLADKAFFYKDISVSEMVDKAVIASKELALHSVALLGINAVNNFKSTSLSQKAMIWENGTNPEIGIKQIEDAVTRGRLNAAKGEEYKKVIKETSKLINQVPTENAKGKPLTDQQKVNYLYNLVIKNKASELSKNVPPQEAAKIDKKALVMDYANELIYDQKTDKQLDDRKGILERKLEPKKDAEGKVIELLEKEKTEYEAELEAINNQIEFNTRFEKITKKEELPDLSVPIEGTDKKGVPIGEDVPTEIVKNEPIAEVIETKIEVQQPTENKGAANIEPPKDSLPTEGGEGEAKGITHAAVAELRKLIDLPEYEGKPREGHEQLIAEAQEIVRNNPIAINDVLVKMEKEGEVSNKDNAIAAVYKATLDAALEKAPTPQLLSDARRLAKALDVSGTKLGKAFESRKLIAPEDNLTNFLLSKEASQGTALTETQIKDQAAKYEELKAAKEALEVELVKEREQHKKDIAELGLNKAKAKAKKDAKKSNEDYKAERKSIVEAAKKKIIEARNNAKVVSTKGVSARTKIDDLTTILPQIKEYVNSLLSEGIDKLDNIITAVTAEFKDVVEGLTNPDILNVLAGEYDVKKQTRAEKANELRLLQREAKLIKELEYARKVEEVVKTEEKKTAANRRIDELTEKIKEVRRMNKQRMLDDEGVQEKSKYAKLKENPPAEKPPKTKLTAEEKNIQSLEKELENLQNGIAKQKNPKRELTDREKELKEQIFEERAKMGLVPSKEIKEPISENEKLQIQLEKRIKKLENDIKTKDFLEEKKPPPTFRKNRKSQILEDRVINLENKIRHERAKDEYNKRAKWRRVWDKVMEVLGIRRVVQTAVDMSVPFRQGMTMVSPRRADIWAKGFQANLKSVFSPKRFERIMHTIRKDEQYHEMEKDGIRYNDMNASDPLLHNEDFRKSFIYKIPIISEPLKASTRSADAFLNVARYEMYKKMRRNLEKKGYTRESDPEAFKKMANWVMNMTGSGKKHKIFDSRDMNTVLGNTFYGANLMASRFNILNPLTYFDTRIPKEVRYEAMKDMASFTTTMVVTATALSYATGAKISLNPDDPDFLQLRYGNKVYDISGGLANYVRTGLRIAKAGYTKASGTKYQGKKATENAGMSGLTFLRNKLSPNTAYGVDMFFGKSYGQDFDPAEAAEIYPMYTEDFLKAIKEEGGLLAVSTVLAPNILGIGYGSYASKGQIDATLEDLIERNLRSDEMNHEKIKNNNDGGRPITVKEFDKFAEQRDELIKKNLKILFEKGIGDTPYLLLSKEQVAAETSYIKSKATSIVKEKLFGQQQKTAEEMESDIETDISRDQNYKFDED